MKSKEKSIHCLDAKTTASIGTKRRSGDANTPYYVRHRIQRILFLIVDIIITMETGCARQRYRGTCLIEPGVDGRYWSLFTGLFVCARWEFDPSQWIINGYAESYGMQIRSCRMDRCSHVGICYECVGELVFFSPSLGTACYYDYVLFIT